MTAPTMDQKRVPAFARHALDAARAAASKQARALVEVLEEQSGLGPADFVERLSATVFLRRVGLEELRGMRPAFELLPYAEALRRGCILLWGEAGEPELVVADPFDLGLVQWADERAGGRMAVLLAHRSDIEACLSRHEETLRATEGMVTLAASSEAGQAAQDISIRSISEDSSPVVRGGRWREVSPTLTAR